MIRGLLLSLSLMGASASAMPAPAAIDDAVAAAMAATGAKGLAVARIENGRVTFVKAYGVRNARGEPLGTDTVMYGASLTKTVFAYTIMQLVDEGKLDLDRAVASYLPKPLPEYGKPWSDLAGDERWQKLTPRMLLNHASGFANFAFLEPDRTLRIHVDPGTRYGYSGQGIALLQLVVEQGLGLDLAAEMQRRVFTPFGMTRTSMRWRDDFKPDMAEGWNIDGRTEGHHGRMKTGAAGSMDTTIGDFARFAAAFMRGESLSKAARAEMVRPQLPITSRSQFPTLDNEAPPAERVPHLAAGLGVVTFRGSQGAGFYKGGHDDFTGNSWVCVERGRKCAVILSNDVRAEPAFPRLVRMLIGNTGIPYRWEYGDMRFLP